MNYPASSFCMCNMSARLELLLGRSDQTSHPRRLQSLACLVCPNCRLGVERTRQTAGYHHHHTRRLRDGGEGETHGVFLADLIWPGPAYVAS